MKGKATFTGQEIEALRQLIRQLEKSDRNEKKRIRAKMRKLGFYGRDDWNIIGMTELQFDRLINEGKIRIIR